MLNVPTTYQYYFEMKKLSGFMLNFKHTKLCFCILFVLCASLKYVFLNKYGQ